MPAAHAHLTKRQNAENPAASRPAKSQMKRLFTWTGPCMRSHMSCVEEPKTVWFFPWSGEHVQTNVLASPIVRKRFKFWIPIWRIPRPFLFDFIHSPFHNRKKIIKTISNTTTCLQFTTPRQNVSKVVHFPVAIHVPPLVAAVATPATTPAALAPGRLRKPCPPCRQGQPPKRCPESQHRADRIDRNCHGEFERTTTMQAGCHVKWFLDVFGVLGKWWLKVGYKIGLIHRGHPRNKKGFCHTFKIDLGRWNLAQELLPKLIHGLGSYTVWLLLLSLYYHFCLYSAAPLDS